MSKPGKKILAIALALLLTLGGFPTGWLGEQGAVYAAGQNPEDFEFYVSGDGIVINNYVGESKDVVIPASIDGKQVIGIDSYAFSDKKLTSVQLPQSLKTIGSLAFSDNMLTSIVIPNGVELIAGDAFRYNELTSVTILNPFVEIYGNPFRYNQEPSSELTISSFDVYNSSVKEYTRDYSYTFKGLQPGTIDPKSAVFDLNPDTWADINVTLVLNDDRLGRIHINESEFTEGMNYTLDNDIVSLKDEAIALIGTYTQMQNKDEFEIEFEFLSGASETLVITIIDTRPSEDEDDDPAGGKRVFSFGSNSYGQLGHGDTDKLYIPKAIEGFANVKQVAAGNVHSLILLDNGDVYAFGRNYHGQLGLGKEVGEVITTPTKIMDIPPIKAIAAGSAHSLLLTENGNVLTFGANFYGQLGLGDSGNFTNRDKPTEIEDVDSITAIYAGGMLSFLLNADGEVYQFGNYGTKIDDNVATPTKLSLGGVDGEGVDIQATKISVGYHHALILTHDGAVYAIGQGEKGQLGHGDKASRMEPTRISGIPEVKDVSAGSEHSLILTVEGDVYAFGQGLYGRLGHGDHENAIRPFKIESLSGLDVAGIEAGNLASYVYTVDGDLYSFGYNDITGHGDSEHVLEPKILESLSGVTAVSADDHVLILADEGTDEEPEDVTITPDAATFDLYESSADYKDLQFTFSAGTLENLYFEDNLLEQSTDYLLDEANRIVTIKKEYMAKFWPGTFSITFFVETGYKLAYVTITDSTPNNPPRPPVNSSPQPVTEEITVDVETGNLGEAVVNQTPIKRTRDNGTVQDEVTLTPERTKEALQSILDAGQSRARVVIPDEQDEVDQVDFSIPVDTSKQISEAQVDLEIFTENVKVQIPASSLADIEEDVYFRLVPIKEEPKRKEVEERARVEQMVVAIAQGQDVQVVARPMTIETNLQSRPVTLVLPLRDVELPNDPAERDVYLAELAIFIEHSDGDKELIVPQVVEYKPGVFGLQFDVSKFSTFTILRMDGVAQSQHHEPYMNGYNDGTFRPNRTITRAEMAAILARNLGFEDGKHAASSYPDVHNTHWALDEIEFVRGTGIMVGDDQGNFRPEAPITRGEMAAIAARYKQLDLSGFTASSFTDVGASFWAAAAIEAAKDAGILEGYEDGTYKPMRQLTRAEAVKIINRLFERGPLHGISQPSWPDVPTTHWAYHEIEEASQAHQYLPRPEGGERIIE